MVTMVSDDPNDWSSLFRVVVVAFVRVSIIDLVGGFRLDYGY